MKILNLIRLSILIFLIPCLLTTGYAEAAQSAEKNLSEKPPFELGIDYFKIKKQPLNIDESNSNLDNNDINNKSETIQKTAELEFFYWYGSSACQQVESLLSEYLTTHPEIIIKRTPLVPRVSWRPQAYIQPILEQLNSPLKQPSSQEIYQACIQDCSVLASYEQIISWLSEKMELAPFPSLEEKLIWQAEKDYRKRAEDLSITQVPTILINEAYRVDADSAKSAKRLIETVDFLLNLKKSN